VSGRVCVCLARGLGR